MCMAMRGKKDHDDGTKRAPEMLATLYAQMKKTNFDVDISDTSRFALKMCEMLSQGGNPEASKLRKDLSYWGMVDATREEFMEAAKARNLKSFFVVGKAETSEEDTKKLQFTATSDLGNTFYDSWCRTSLCFDSPLNAEHTGDLVESLLALYWLQVRTGMEQPYGSFKDLHAAMVLSLRVFKMPNLDTAIGSLLDATHPAEPGAMSTARSARSNWEAASSTAFPPPPPFALTREGQKLERIAIVTAEIVASMKVTRKAVHKLKRLVDTPADQLEHIQEVSDTDGEGAGTKRKASDGGQGEVARKGHKTEDVEYTLSMAFGYGPQVLEGTDKEAALKDLKGLAEDATSVAMTLPQGIVLPQASAEAMIDYLSALPEIEYNHHMAIRAKCTALLRHSNPSILPMSSYWAPLQHVHAHLARASTWDSAEVTTTGRYLPSPWHLYKELACSWDGKGFVFQFLVLNCGYDDMQVFVRADPEGRVAHTIATNGAKQTVKTGSKGSAKGGQIAQGSTWNARSFTPQPWGDSWGTTKWEW
jgi:hypothetical protein